MPNVPIYSTWQVDSWRLLSRTELATVQTEAMKRGYNVIYDLTGHGIGRGLHESPEQILNFHNPNDRRILNDGLVIVTKAIALRSDIHDQADMEMRFIFQDRKRVFRNLFIQIHF